MNRDFDDIVQRVRPPAPEIPSAERLARERQQIFHSYQPGQVGHEAPNSGPVARPEICILDERGGHKSLGVNCPHFAGYNANEVIEVGF